MEIPQVVEVEKDSRSISAGINTMDQKFAVVIVLDPDDLDSDHSGVEVFGASDDVVALETAYTVFPALRFLPNSAGTLRALRLNQIRMEHLGQHRWRAEADYSFDAGKGQGGDEAPSGNGLDYIKINFNIGGGTKHITRSLSVVEASNKDGVSIPNQTAAPAVDGHPPWLRGAIGVTKDAITGYDVPDDVFRVQITGYFYPAFIDLDYLNVLKGLCGKYNNSTFLDCDAGEVLFLNAVGGGTVVDIIPITFDFLISENLNAVSDSGGFPPITCLGHDVIDYVYKPEHVEGAETIFMTPTYRYIHRVAKPGNFSDLGLPL